jgi:hypothetical protein
LPSAGDTVGYGINRYAYRLKRLRISFLGTINCVHIVLPRYVVRARRCSMRVGLEKLFACGKQVVSVNVNVVTSSLQTGL